MLLFEADSLRGAMLESMHTVPANASLAATYVVPSMALLEGGRLAVGTARRGLFFESVQRLAGSPSRYRLAILEGRSPRCRHGLKRGAAVRGCEHIQKIFISRAMRGATRDVQANASLAARYVNSLQLLEDGHLAVAHDIGEGGVLLPHGGRGQDACAGQRIFGMGERCVHEAAGGWASCCWHRALRGVAL